MITTMTAPCISVIYDICIMIIWWYDLELHMSYITEIQEAVVVVIIWWCDLQLHMSYITEIQGAVMVVIIWWCDLELHMSYITEIQHNNNGLLYFGNI
jgi:hypothetical protein